MSKPQDATKAKPPEAAKAKPAAAPTKAAPILARANTEVKPNSNFTLNGEHGLKTVKTGVPLPRGNYVVNTVDYHGNGTASVSPVGSSIEYRVQLGDVTTIPRTVASSPAPALKNAPSTPKAAPTVAPQTGPLGGPKFRLTDELRTTRDTLLPNGEYTLTSIKPFDIGGATATVHLTGNPSDVLYTVRLADLKQTPGTGELFNHQPRTASKPTLTGQPAAVKPAPIAAPSNPSKWNIGENFTVNEGISIKEFGGTRILPKGIYTIERPNGIPFGELRKVSVDRNGTKETFVVHRDSLAEIPNNSVQPQANTLRTPAAPAAPEATLRTQPAAAKPWTQGEKVSVPPGGKIGPHILRIEGGGIVPPGEYKVKATNYNDLTAATLEPVGGGKALRVFRILDAA